MSERAYARLLAAGALLLAAGLAWPQVSLGDYPTDAGPALAWIGHGNLAGFFAHQPAMGPLSLYVRAPFVLLASALHDGTVGAYRWGCFPCLLAVGAVALWMAQIARRRGAGRPAMALIVLACLFNPLVKDALYWGHPEDLLTASLALGALLAAAEGRPGLVAVLSGLALASKQWAVLVIVPAILLLEHERLRVLARAAGLAAVAWLPMAVANLGAFRYALRYVSQPQPVVTMYSWLYPIAPTRLITISNPFGDARTFPAHHLPGLEAAAARPLLTLLGVAIPWLFWWRAARRPSIEAMLLATALVLVCRCALDPGAMPYYNLPLLMVMLAADALAGRRVPVLGLVALATSFVVLDRFPLYFSAGVVNLVYIAASATACTLLLRALRGSSKANVGMLAPAR